MGNAPGELAQGIHFLRLEQLRFGSRQLGGGVGQLGLLVAFAMAMFGDIFDKHQAQFGTVIGRDLPLGFAQLPVDLHLQRSLPALTGPQAQAQLLDHRELIGGKAFEQGVRIEVVVDQLGERVVAFVHFQLCVHHRNRCADVEEDLSEARLAFA